MPNPKSIPKIIAKSELPGIDFSTVTSYVEDTTITWAGGVFLGGGIIQTSFPLASHFC